MRTPAHKTRSTSGVALTAVLWLTAVVLLTTAASAAASATFTYPANGQTVTLDKNLNFDFRWTLPPTESYPNVYVGDQSTFDPNNSFAPFQSWCGGDNAVETSCRMPDGQMIPPAGLHYAVIATGDNAGGQFVSPEISFTVPYEVGLGCVPGVGCEWPKVSNVWAPLGGEGYGYPFTQFNIWGWTNGSTLKMAYTLRDGRRVLKRWHGSLLGNVLFGSPQPEHLNLYIYSFRGIPVRAPLRLTVSLTSGTSALTRTFAVHAGGGPKKGVVTYAEST